MLATAKDTGKRSVKDAEKIMPGRIRGRTLGKCAGQIDHTYSAPGNEPFHSFNRFFWTRNGTSPVQQSFFDSKGLFTVHILPKITDKELPSKKNPIPKSSPSLKIACWSPAAQFQNKWATIWPPNPFNSVPCAEFCPGFKYLFRSHPAGLVRIELEYTKEL